ncbi:phosphoribosylamine/glycine ligase [Stackebrandtia nassauensis DSM 44728]|uniref:Phosphoribosylamine--glycine ligase n=1 Tax=Stackebrandtia nassauensis (strain DSM 44728 / CIP 108903 / NRRL B-16338 / NBRC 102104 / LLR-40K-21) TaxID=446470 RepID=D3Q2L7_STANL|nr:phosphoribosylamine/glycine ligase [Stackebrandtia nassauensis DSM 44728]
MGTGGREHALAVALAHDSKVETLICAPGNPGMAACGELRDVDMGDPDAIAALAVEVEADLVVVGPEAPLVAGAADAVRAKGIACYGPSAKAAAIEGSKTFAKEIMAAAGVPTAKAHTCHTAAEAEAALDEFGPPYVVKDDALAAGKGVVVTSDRDEALAHAAACDTVVIEEFLDGPEVSLFVVTDGTTAVPLLPAQDFKRVGEDDAGPNTGGMGAYTPLPWAPDDLVDTIMTTVAEPTLAELAKRETPFVGTLYCGLALTSKGPKVIEFNCRFGDPEIQAVLALLDAPLSGLLDAAARGKLAEYPKPQWRDGAAVCVVLASEGYPEKPVTGKPITGADMPGVLHAGTALDADGQLVSSGGRVLNVVAPGATLNQARRRAYALAAGVELPDARIRRDIALAASEDRIVAPGA